MRRIILLLTVAAMLATMLLALAGPSLAQITDGKKQEYTVSNFGNGYQFGGTQDAQGGTGIFKAFANGKLPKSLLQGNIKYTGVPGPEATSVILTALGTYAPSPTRPSLPQSTPSPTS